MSFNISLEEENEILDAYEKSGNIKDLERLFLGNEKLIFKKVAKMSPFFPSLYDIDDMMQEVYLHLITSIKYFDRSKGVRFSTYFLSTCISQRITFLIKRQEAPCHNNNEYIPLSVIDTAMNSYNSEDGVVSFIDTVASPSLSPEEITSTHELLDLLDEKIKTFDLDTQETLYHKFSDGGHGTSDHYKISDFKLFYTLQKLKEDKLLNSESSKTTVSSVSEKPVKVEKPFLTTVPKSIGANKKIKPISRLSSKTSFTSISDNILARQLLGELDEKYKV